MSSLPRLAQDILQQPQSLRGVLDRHFARPGLELLARCGAMLRGARRIVLTGMGSSLYSLQPAANMLLLAGYPVQLIETSELLHFQSLPDSHTAIVAVSRSGESIETLKLLDNVRSTGARVIGVTNVDESTLAVSADETILIGSLADELVAIQSYTGGIAVLLALAAETCGVFNRQWRQSLQHACSALERYVPACIEAGQTWQSFLSGAPCVYLLGRGASIGSALEGALLFHEASKVSAVAMSAGNFRHGPVEVVDSVFRGIVFCSEAKTRALDLSLAADLRLFGGQIVSIGFDQPSPLGIPEIAPQFAPIVEIVPVQVATLRLAQWRGLIPGVFRFAGLVTMSEESFQPVEVR